MYLCKNVKQLSAQIYDVNFISCSHWGVNTKPVRSAKTLPEVSSGVHWPGTPGYLHLFVSIQVASSQSQGQTSWKQFVVLDL